MKPRVLAGGKLAFFDGKCENGTVLFIDEQEPLDAVFGGQVRLQRRQVLAEPTLPDMLSVSVG